jgi:type IV secretion system protein VirD4
MRWLRPFRPRRRHAPAGRRILGLTFDGRPILEPKNAGSTLVFAAAGGGKTTCVAVPAIECLLADPGRAFFANDVKQGEIAAQVAPLCTLYGRKFGMVDDFAVLGKDNPFRLSLNPFGAAVEAVRNDDADLPFIIDNICHALIEEPKDDAKNFYWRESPREFLAVGLNILLERHPRLATPGGLNALLRDPRSWHRALSDAADADDMILAAGAHQIVALMADNPEHYSQHLRAALSALKIYASGPLAEAGRSPDLTHRELIADGWGVCFVNPARHTDRLGAHYALHFLALMNAQLSGNVGAADYILDEVCNAPMRDALNRVTIQRAYRARSLFIAQSRQDIVRRYGEKETAILEENCTTKQWLKFSNFEEAERVSKAMGDGQAVSTGLGLSSNRNDYSSNYSSGRERLFTADMLMKLPPDEQVVHLPDVGFIHCKKIRQNEIGPFCFDLGANPLEGAPLPPDPKVWLDVPPARDAGEDAA